MPLPVDAPTAETLTTAQAPSASPPATGAVPSGRRVLVIDDSALMREAARVALGTIGGWDVLVAESGEQGIAMAETLQPDAILLDVVMPDMDGIAVAERLRANPDACALPVVFLTGSERPEDREHFQRLPVHGVIAKPFDVTQLAGELAGLLGWPR